MESIASHYAANRQKSINIKQAVATSNAGSGKSLLPKIQPQVPVTVAPQAKQEQPRKKSFQSLSKPKQLISRNNSMKQQAISNPKPVLDATKDKKKFDSKIVGNHCFSCIVRRLYKS